MKKTCGLALWVLVLVISWGVAHGTDYFLQVDASVSGCNGIIVPSGIVLVGNDAWVDFHAVPDANYHLASVVVDGQPQAAVSPFRIYPNDRTHTVVVAFAPDPGYAHSDVQMPAPDPLSAAPIGAGSRWAPTLQMVNGDHLWMAWTGWEHYCYGPDAQHVQDIGIVTATMAYDDKHPFKSDPVTGAVDFQYEGTLIPVDPNFGFPFQYAWENDIFTYNTTLAGIQNRCPPAMLPLICCFARERSQAAPAMVRSGDMLYFAWTTWDGELYFLSLRGSDSELRDAYSSPLLTAYQSRVQLFESTLKSGVLISDYPNTNPTGHFTRWGTDFDCTACTTCPQFQNTRIGTPGAGPAMIEASVEGGPRRLYVAWTGTDNQHSLNIKSSADQGRTWDKLWPPLPEYSDYAPALCEYKGKLYIAWTDKTSHQLCLMSSDNGRDFNLGSRITLAEHSIASPALATIGGYLALAWNENGTDSGRLNVLFSSDGFSFPSYLRWTSPTGTFSSTCQSDTGPSLASGFSASPDRGFIAWQYYDCGAPRVGILEVAP